MAHYHMFSVSPNCREYFDQHLITELLVTFVSEVDTFFFLPQLESDLFPLKILFNCGLLTCLFFGGAVSLNLL